MMNKIRVLWPKPAQDKLFSFEGRHFSKEVTQKYLKKHAYSLITIQYVASY